MMMNFGVYDLPSLWASASAKRKGSKQLYTLYIVNGELKQHV
jgi:hypothetical protein